MKLIAISDIHVRATAPINRKDDYVEAQFRKLRQVIDYANEIGAPILSAGDLLDKPTIPYWLFNRLTRELRRLDREFYVIPGNHCLKGHTLDALNEGALQSLSETGAIELLTFPQPLLLGYKPKDGKAFHEVMLHPLPFGLGNESLRPPEPGRYNILMLHEPVYEKTVPFFMTDGLTIKGLEKKYPGYDLYLAGDTHIPAVASKTIVTGSMMRMTIAQKDFKPRFYEIDTITGAVTPHYFEIEEDVWKDIIEVADDDTYKAELRELVEEMSSRDERLDYAATCRQLAADRPEYAKDLQTLINQYEETKK
jgi:DNA repair exonuclease SbcCD nuclease subunit